jgi:hypothetical protein
MSDKLKVTQTTKVTGQVDANDMQARVAGQSAGAGSQSADGGCPECQGKKRAGQHKAG